MSSPSPIALVYQALQEICNRAESHASIFHKNEAATRTALIEPLLRTLGWDTANVQMVEPEKTLGNDLRVDYLLRDALGRPCIVIEAKCLGSNLDKYSYVGKILGYAIALNVQTVCITDGISWHIHSNLHQGKSEPITFELTESELLASANHLIDWLDSAQSGHGIGSGLKASGVHEPSDSSVTRTKTNAQKPAAKTKAATKVATHQPDYIDLSQLHMHSLPPGQKPKMLRLPDGSIKPIKTWKDILLEVCRLALATNPAIQLPLPDKAGKKRFLLSKTKPLVGSSTATLYNTQQVFIYTHYSASDCITNALYAVQQIPTSHQETSIAVSF
ncbi:hypothetical protein GCM10023185_29440 [Hymenobacter saemangeumensis]|uniref:Type I restriction enzyme R protein N-terminal domain-containing protein n=1 Tax=Hymenobacter saemangeumensis TaxID=1084522 RepID=A0ABP8IM06_9BACT